MSWRHVVIEGYCFGEKKHTYPCNRPHISPFCLGDTGTETCPYFAWSDSDEREVAYWVPLHLIIWDRIRYKLTEEIFPTLSWIFWDKWFSKYDEWVKNIKVIKHPEIDEWHKKMEKDFPDWLRKAKKGEEVIEQDYVWHDYPYINH